MHNLHLIKARHDINGVVAHYTNVMLFCVVLFCETAISRTNHFFHIALQYFTAQIHPYMTESL